MIMYPLKLKYYAKTALWGGDTLKKRWGKTCEFDKLAETWELTVRAAENNIIENGEHSGLSLQEYLRQNPTAISPGGSCEDFPLLVKFIDARDDLSVQVHPDDTFAADVENDRGKTEMWYILEAMPQAEIIYGLRKGVSSEDFARAIDEGRTLEALHRVKVKTGETYFIPAGEVHAIGAGCLIAEIQQNSDLTYRVYDYDRVGADGKQRELHVQKAAAVSRPFDEASINAIRFANKPRFYAGDCLASCRYFEVHRLTPEHLPMAFAATGDSFHHLLCADGEGEISHRGIAYPLHRGDSYFLPAGMGDYSLRGNATVLLSVLP